MIVSLIDVKNYLNIPLANTTYDVFLNNQIKVVTTAIENFCNRSIVARNFEETFYGDCPRTGNAWGTALYHYPIIAITAIEKEENGQVENYNVSEFRVHKPTGIISMKPFDTRFRPIWGQTLVFKYRAGYEEIPADIVDVALSIIGERYNKKINGVDMSFGNDVQSVSIPGVISISYDYSLEDNQEGSQYGSILGKYKNILSYYRNERTIYKGSGELKYCDNVI